MKVVRLGLGLGLGLQRHDGGKHVAHETNSKQKRQIDTCRVTTATRIAGHDINQMCCSCSRRGAATYMKNWQNSLSDARVRRREGEEGSRAHVTRRTYVLDELQRQGIEDHVDGFVGAKHHPQVDEQAEGLHEQLCAAVDQASDAYAAADAEQAAASKVLFRC